MHLRRLCLGFNGARAELSFFKVGGKVFAIAPLDGEPPLLGWSPGAQDGQP